jgi:hypothetical protein
MRGLDPRIHDEGPLIEKLKFISSWHGIMDCRVKPGNDTESQR